LADLQLEQLQICPNWLAEIEKQCSCRAQASVKKVSEEENGNLVGILPVFCSEIALHGSRLRHFQSLHAVIVETEDLGPLEPHDKPLQTQADFRKLLQRKLDKIVTKVTFETKMQSMPARCCYRRKSDACCCMENTLHECTRNLPS